jgi:lipoprotein Spr
MQLSRSFLILSAFLLSCSQAESFYQKQVATQSAVDTPAQKILNSTDENGQSITRIKTGEVTPSQIVTYARTLTGIPYKYGSTDPQQGFDCSGFITYTFNHFKIAVPRSSVDFTQVEHEIQLKDAKPGDLILFTGTDSTLKKVGHMGILVTTAAEGHQFIHSTSGKANGVTETPLNAYYQGRYLKTIRIFPQNDH